MSSIGIQEPRPLPEKLNGALLVAASVVAAIRLRGEPIRPSPRLQSIVSESITLARTVLRALQSG